MALRKQPRNEQVHHLVLAYNYFSYLFPDSFHAFMQAGKISSGLKCIGVHYLFRI
jgi:hypothetical protein